MSILIFNFSSLARASAAQVPTNPNATNTPSTRTSLSLSADHADPLVGRRALLSVSFGAALGGLSTRGSSQAAILEADDDEELLERVKKDRQKRLQRQGVISSFKKETGYLQELVYKLSKVGQAIENSDLSTAGSVLARSTDSDWLQNINTAFTKLSSSPEEKTEAETFNSSLTSLISSVDKNDIESSRLAFVASASALEKWAGLADLNGQLKGL